MKKLWIALILALTLCLLCGAALADTVYTVTLTANPSEGGTVTGAGTYPDGNTVTIAASANDGYRFDHWERGDGSFFVETASHAFVIHDNISLVAVFVEGASNVSSYTLAMPQSVTISPNAVTTAFAVNVSALDLRPNASGNTPESFRVKINAATLVNQSDSDKTISFKLCPENSTLGTTEAIYLRFDRAQSKPGYIVITSSQWEAATPGVYTGTMSYQTYYQYSNGDPEWLETGSIPVTLTIPSSTSTYTVIVNNGTGSGEYEEGESVTITANEPEAGKQFNQWNGADGLTFTFGSATTATATFTMPASAVMLTATYEDMRYAITDDGAAQAYCYDDNFNQVFPTEATAGTELSLWVRENATPDTGNYFTGEFWYIATDTEDLPDRVIRSVIAGEFQYVATCTDTNPLVLGSVTENGATNPVTDFTMPAYDVTIGAVQATRENLTLDFTQSASASLPLEAWMQLQMFGSENPLILYDDVSGLETLDVNLDGTGDLLITHPDETATDITLTLLPGWTAFGCFDFAFTGATDHYGAISFILPTPAFVAPDFTLPMSISTIEANAFEGIAATVVDIPEGCASIGDYAFKACPNLTQIRIPASVTTIGTDIFNGCAHTVYVFGTANSEAETYCQDHTNCVFVAE